MNWMYSRCFVQHVFCYGDIFKRHLDLYPLEQRMLACKGIMGSVCDICANLCLFSPPICNSFFFFFFSFYFFLLMTTYHNCIVKYINYIIYHHS